MITESTAKQLLIQAEPDLSIISNKENSIFKLVYRFAELVRAEIVNGEFSRLQKDFEMAEQLLKEGDYLVRVAMANVFVLSLVNTLAGYMRMSFSLRAFSMLPELLKKEYYRQLRNPLISMTKPINP